jgi:hypothetical protein
MMSNHGTAALIAALSLAGVGAEPLTPPLLARAPAAPAVVASTSAQPAAPAALAASLGRPEPLATLGRPTPLEPPPPPAATSGFPVALNAPAVDRAVVVVRAQAPETSTSLTGPPPVPPPPATDSGLPPIVPSDGYNASVVIDRPLNKSWWDNCRGWLGGGLHSSTAGTHGWFASDHCFDNMISPLSNPFLFEDPRAVTELRPLFFYQRAPSDLPTDGGHGEFYGLQGRIAFNQNWSLVINKFGYVTLHPNVGVDGIEGNGSGFAELWLGPKYTFLRCEQTGSVAAVGLTFQFPIGDRKVFQDTGDLGLDPYVTYAQTFGKSSYGSFNFIGELGYDFSVDSHRSSFLHGSLHLDYDVANLQRFYPLVELNWFYYTSGGKGPVNGFEGDDFINFGATGVSGRDDVTLALGMRYKFSECIQLGVYGEAPLTSKHDLMDYRLGVDMIFRY